MKKVAKLITVELTTRVIVDEDANDISVLDAAKDQLAETLRLGSLENISKIKEDKECPFGSLDIDEIS